MGVQVDTAPSARPGVRPGRENRKPGENPGRYRRCQRVWGRSSAKAGHRGNLRRQSVPLALLILYVPPRKVRRPAWRRARRPGSWAGAPGYTAEKGRGGCHAAAAFPSPVWKGVSYEASRQRHRRMGAVRRFAVLPVLSGCRPVCGQPPGPRRLLCAPGRPQPHVRLHRRGVGRAGHRPQRSRSAPGSIRTT